MANQYRKDFEYTYTPLPLENYAKFVAAKQLEYDANLADGAVPYGWKGGRITGEPGADGAPSQAKERSDYYTARKESVYNDYATHKNPTLLAKEMNKITTEQLNDKSLQEVILDEQLSPKSYEYESVHPGGFYGWIKKNPDGSIRNLTIEEARAEGGLQKVYGNVATAPEWKEELQFYSQAPSEVKDNLSKIREVQGPNGTVYTLAGSTTEYRNISDMVKQGVLGENASSWLDAMYDNNSTQSSKYFNKLGEKESYLREAIRVLTPYNIDNLKREEKFIPGTDVGGGGGNSPTTPLLDTNYTAQKMTVGFDPTNDKSNYGGAAITEYQNLLTKREKDPTNFNDVDKKRLNNLIPYVEMVQQKWNEFNEDPKVKQEILDHNKKKLAELGFSQSTLDNPEFINLWEKASKEWAALKAAVQTENMAMGAGAGERIVGMTREAFINFANQFNKAVKFEMIKPNDFVNENDKLLKVNNKIKEGRDDLNEKLKKKYLQPAIDDLPNSTDVNLYTLDDTNAGKAAAAENVVEAQKAIQQGQVDPMGMMVSVSDGGKGSKKLDIDKPDNWLDMLERNWGNLPGLKVDLEGIGDDLYMLVKYNSVADEGDVYTNKDGEVTKSGTTTVKIPITDESIGKLGGLVKEQGQYGLNFGNNVDNNSGIFKIFNNYETHQDTGTDGAGVGGNDNWYSQAPDFNEHLYENYGVKSSLGRTENIVENLKKETGMVTVKGHKLRGDIAKEKFVSMESSILPQIDGGYSSGRIIYKGENGKDNRPITLTDVLKEGLLQSQINVDPNDGSAINVTIGSTDYATTFINSAMKAAKAKDRENVKVELEAALDNNNTDQINTILSNYGLTESPFVFSSKTMANVYLWSGEAVGGKK